MRGSACCLLLATAASAQLPDPGCIAELVLDCGTSKASADECTACEKANAAALADANCTDADLSSYCALPSKACTEALAVACAATLGDAARCTACAAAAAVNLTAAGCTAAQEATFCASPPVPAASCGAALYDLCWARKEASAAACAACELQNRAALRDANCTGVLEAGFCALPSGECAEALLATCGIAALENATACRQCTADNAKGTLARCSAADASAFCAIRLPTLAPGPPAPAPPAGRTPVPGGCQVGAGVSGVYRDMGDGDKKEIQVADGVMTITPYGNDQTWTVTAAVDAATCSAVVDFNVPDKPHPPPCKLTATLWEETDLGGDFKSVWEFSDPTDACQFGAAGTPLNTWVQANSTNPYGPLPGAVCPTSVDAVYADMQDGDRKAVSVDGTAMTIKPSGNNQTWTVTAKVDPTKCSALVDFNVAGKPNPPPCKLLATLWMESYGDTSKDLLEFTDPTDKCQFGEPGSAINTWVRLP